MNKSFLQIKSLKKKFIDSTDEIVVLDDINLDLTTNKLVALTGPSGSGKSTFIHLLGLLDIPDRGEYNLDTSKNLFNLSDKEKSDYRRRNISIVFQNFNLFWHMNLIENIIEAPIRVLKIEKNRAIEIAEDLLEKVGLIDKRNSFPKKLSGGQQQRGAIARALAMNPEVMLFDEPTSALDPETINEVLKVIEKLAIEGMTMLIVTHEINFAKKISSRIMMLDEGVVIDDSYTKDFFNSNSNQRKYSFLNQDL